MCRYEPKGNLCKAYSRRRRGMLRIVEGLRGGVPKGTAERWASLWKISVAQDRAA